MYSLTFIFISTSTNFYIKWTINLIFLYINLFTLSSSVPYTLSNPPAIIKKIYINFYIV